MDFRLVCTQRPRRAEAFSRHRASVEHPTRRRADSEGCAPGNCAARRVFFGFKYPYSKRVGSPVGRAGSSVLRDCAARKRFPAVELPSIIQRVGVPIRRGGAPGDCAARRALFRFQISILQQTSRLSGLEGRLVCLRFVGFTVCCCTCATGWPCRSSRRCRRTCRCPCGWT